MDKQKLLKIARYADRGETALLEYILELDDKLANIMPEFSAEMQRVASGIVGQKGDKGDRGEKGERGER